MLIGDINGQLELTRMSREEQLKKSISGLPRVGYELVKSNVRSNVESHQSMSLISNGFHTVVETGSSSIWTTEVLTRELSSFGPKIYHPATCLCSPMWRTVATDRPKQPIPKSMPDCKFYGLFISRAIFFFTFFDLITFQDLKKLNSDWFWSKKNLILR